MNFFKVKILFFIALLIIAINIVFSNCIALSNENSKVFSNYNDQHIVWNRKPIKITLPVGKERFISFPSEMKFGYNMNLLPASMLRVENNNKTLYLLAKRPFNTKRVQVKLVNGEVILLDINARKYANDNPVDIILLSSKTLDSVQNNKNWAKINYVSLTRYAIQQLYAPQRLLKNKMNITRFPMEVNHIVPLFYDNSILVMPLASWRGRDLYVTALLVKNLLNQFIRLDPRLLCGNWKTASFYPKMALLPSGSPINGDVSTLFVISDRPFFQAIQNCLNQE